MHYHLSEEDHRMEAIITGYKSKIELVFRIYQNSKFNNAEKTNKKGSWREIGNYQEKKYKCL